MKTDWVEVDPEAIGVNESSYLLVLDEETMKTIPSPLRNGTLIFTKDTEKFYIYDKGHTPYKRPSWWQRLRRSLWHA